MSSAEVNALHFLARDLDPVAVNADIYCMTEDAQNEELTKEELLEEAREKDLPGRSQMSKTELAEALGKVDHDHVAELADWRKNEYQGAQDAQ